MNEDEYTQDMLFIMSVSDFVAKKPHHATKITDAIQQGIMAAIEENKKYGMNMEVIAMISLARLLKSYPQKGFAKLIESKLNDIRSHCRLNLSQWDELINKMLEK